MKKIFLMLLVMILCAQSVLCARVMDEKKAAEKKMYESLKFHHETCVNLARNFRYDHQFSSYLKFRCQLFESDRQRLVNSIFPVTSNSTSEYRQNYPIIKSQFIINLNDSEIKTYKTIVTEYCKYHSQMFVKKDPKMCSPDRIQSLFQTMP